MPHDSGFRAVIANLTKTGPSQILGHTFVGYRLKGFNEFLAVFEGSAGEVHHDKHTCELRAKNATPGTEAHEGAAFALKHWPSA
jgi:hypothetical protein